MKKRTWEEIQLNGIAMICTFVLAAAYVWSWMFQVMYIRPIIKENPLFYMPIIAGLLFLWGMVIFVYSTRHLNQSKKRKSKCTMEITGELKTYTQFLKYPVIIFDNFWLVMKDKIDGEIYKKGSEITVMIDPDGTELYPVDDKFSRRSDIFLIILSLFVMLGYFGVFLYCMKEKGVL